MTRILITGSAGMVGREVTHAARLRNWEVAGFTHAELDVANRDAVLAAVIDVKPDLVINAAAYTQVDTAEDEENLARRVNREGPAYLAQACAALGAPLIHVSTDYVFDGRSNKPYVPNDQANPLGVYGRTKWEGEQEIRMLLPRHLIVRTSWLFAAHGRNFFRTIVRLARERETIRVVNDQWGCPTLAADLAKALCTAAARVREGHEPWGTYHYCNAGPTTWCDFASAIVQGLAARETNTCRVLPIGTSEWPTRATRPQYSVLDSTTWVETFGLVPRPWREALEDAVRRLE